MEVRKVRDGDATIWAAIDDEVWLPFLAPVWEVLPCGRQANIHLPFSPLAISLSRFIHETKISHLFLQKLEKHH